MSQRCPKIQNYGIPSQTISQTRCHNGNVPSMSQCRVPKHFPKTWFFKHVTNIASQKRPKVKMRFIACMLYRCNKRIIINIIICFNKCTCLATGGYLHSIGPYGGVQTRCGVQGKMKAYVSVLCVGLQLQCMLRSVLLCIALGITGRDIIVNMTVTIPCGDTFRIVSPSQ